MHRVPFLVFLAALALLSCADDQPVALFTVAPSSGSIDGGTLVTLKGENFSPGTKVRFGEVEGSSIVVIDGETITAVTPPHPPELVAVEVERPGGDAAVLPDAFTFIPHPTDGDCITTIVPAFGSLDVDVVSAVRVTFNKDVDPTSLESAFSLVTAGTQTPIAFDQTVVAPNEVELRPVSSLGFFSDYAVTVSGVNTVSGDACPDEGGLFSTRSPEAEPRPLRPAPVHDVELVGDAAIVVSATYRGLQIYDIATPETPILVRDLLMEGTPLGITLEGDRAYVPAGAFGVYIYDVVDPLNPVLLGIAGTPGTAVEVVPFTRNGSRYLAVADRLGGLRILDATEPEGSDDIVVVHPNGSLDADVLGIAMEGDLIAAAMGADGFALVDVTTLASPTVLTVRQSQAVPDTFDASRWVNDVVLADGTLFISLYAAGLQAFNVATPSAPIFVDHALGPQGLCTANCPDELGSLTYDDGSVFSASAMTGAARFQFDGAQLSLEGVLPLPGRVHSVSLRGDELWVGSERGLGLFSKTAPSGSAPLFGESSGWGSSQGILATGDYLYVASASRGLETYSLADPRSPLLLMTTPTAGAESDVGLLNILTVGNVLVVGDGRAGLTLFDLGTPAAPVASGSIVGADTIGAMVPGDGHVFACDGTYALWSVDITNPASPTYESYDLAPDVGGCYGITILGNKLFVAGSVGLGVYDVTTGVPLLDTAVVLPAEDVLFDLAVRDGYLYATTYANDHEGTHGAAQRLVVFDISDPAAPKRVFKSDDLGGVVDLAIRGDKLFIAGRGQGVWVWGLSEPSTPKLEGQIEFPGDVYRLSQSGGDAEFLYVSQRGGGIGVAELGKLPAN